MIRNAPSIFLDLLLFHRYYFSIVMRLLLLFFHIILLFYLNLFENTQRLVKDTAKVRFYENSVIVNIAVGFIFSQRMN